MAWQYRAGKFIWRHRKKISRAVSVEKLRKRTLKYRKKLKRTPTKTLSRGKSSIDRSGGRTTKRRKSMRAPLTPKDKPKFVRYRKGGCPPGYVYDVKRKMCIQRRYR